MRVFFDTEFIDDGKTVDLISIGMIRADGRVYYAESSECDLSRACEWVKQNVINKLDGKTKSRAQIAREIAEFVGPNPEFWGYFSAYDWLVLCQLYGRMLDVPAGWPNFCFDVQQVACLTGAHPLPPNNDMAHNALTDAAWTMRAFEHVMRRKAA